MGIRSILIAFALLFPVLASAGSSVPTASASQTAAPAYTQPVALDQADAARHQPDAARHAPDVSATRTAPSAPSATEREAGSHHAAKRALVVGAVVVGVAAVVALIALGSSGGSSGGGGGY